MRASTGRFFSRDSPSVTFGSTHFRSNINGECQLATRRDRGRQCYRKREFSHFQRSWFERDSMQRIRCEITGKNYYTRCYSLEYIQSVKLEAIFIRFPFPWNKKKKIEIRISRMQFDDSIGSSSLQFSWNRCLKRHLYPFACNYIDRKEHDTRSYPFAGVKKRERAFTLYHH